MTCIVGIRQGSSVWIGGDSASSDGNTLATPDTAKVFARGDYLFGITGSWRVGQLLAHGLDEDGNGPPVVPLFPSIHAREDAADAFLVTQFGPWFRKMLEHNGAHRKDAERYWSDGSFLMAVGGLLYAVDGQLGMLRHTFYATGTGGQVALGSLYTSEQLRLPADVRVKHALDAASFLTPFVHPPFNIMVQRHPGGVAET